MVQWEQNTNNRVNLEGALGAPRFDFGDDVPPDRLDGSPLSAGYHILNMEATPGGLVPNLQIFVDGRLDAQGGASSANPLNNGVMGQFILGQWAGGSVNANMDLGEVVIFGSDLTATEQAQVDSYLAIKYGITLDQTTARNYFDSQGNVVWDAATNSMYDNDIAGIGRDLTSALDQSQSKSISSDAIVTMSSASDQHNREFLIWGNDDGALVEVAGEPAGVASRLDRVWRVAETGDVGTTTIVFNLTGLTYTGTTAAEFRLIVDNDADFSNGATTIAATSYSGASQIVTFTGVNLGDGEFFALGTDTSGNTAPVLTDTAINLNPVNEDAGFPVGAIGTLVSSVVDFLGGGGQDNVTDADGGSVTGIAVTAANASTGTWFYSTDDGAVWNPLGAVTTTNSRLLAANLNTRIYFQPNVNYNGTVTPAITFHAWDQTSGVNGGTADVTVRGGTSAYSTATETADITVTPVNNAPVISNLAGDTLAYNAGAGPVAIEQGADALVTDVDSTNFDTGNLTVSITTGGDPSEDVLSIRHDGMALGQIGLVSGDVFHSGVQIGTATGGSGGVDLIITFNANVTPVAVTALLETITFENTDTVSPTAGSRIIRFTIDDGDGSVSLGDDVTVAVGSNVLVVDTASDLLDGDTNSIADLLLDRGADGLISLREAILATNATAGLDLITFNIAGAGVHTIQINSTGEGALPFITDGVIIDGYTQPLATTNTLLVGGNATLLIELDGSLVGGTGDGLHIAAGGDGTTIRGLVINRFGGDGIEINTAGGASIEGNFIGTNVAGVADRGNGLDGIRVDNSANNLIGGSNPAARNIISGNNIHGVRIVGAGSTNNLVQGNYIGINAAGLAPLGQNFNGIWIAGGANSNTIGGTAVGAGNVVSGNGDTGIEIQGSSSTGNLVQGNFIGTNAAGTAAIGNLDGVIIEDAPGNTIGGTAAGAGNVISGNLGDGVVIFGTSSTGNLVQGNFIGVDVTGNVALGNVGNGVALSNQGDGGGPIGGASFNTIGGTAAGAGNVISGNQNDGLNLSGGANNNQMLGNLIGTNAAGIVAMGNGDDGIQLFDGANNNTIGGAVAGAGNVIADSGDRGISIKDPGTHGNTMLGNWIGTDKTESFDLGNATSGVLILDSAANNVVGGTGSAAGNVIAYSGTVGVELWATAGNGNGIRSNRIYSNAALGIDLVGGVEDGFGVTANDLGDGDSGPNNLQNYPVLSSAIVSGSDITVTGSLTTTASKTLIIDFFASATADGSGYGEARTFLGSRTVTTDTFGNAGINETFLGAGLAAGDFITATATDPNGNTSEFGQSIAAVPAPNAAPTITNLDGDTLNYNEDDPARLIEQGTDVAVVDGDSPNFDTGNLTVSVFAGGDASEDVLSIRHQGMSGGQIGFDGTNVFFGGTLIGTAAGGSGGVDLVATFNVNADTIAASALIENITYQNSDTADPSIAPRTVRFMLKDGDGGTSAAHDAVVNVALVNDAPKLDNTGAMTLTDINEDDAGPVGDTVAAILASAGGDRLTDADSVAMEGVAVIGVDDSNGSWQYNAGSGWTNVGAVTDSSAVLLDSTARIRFVPNADYNGSSGKITFRAWDQTDGNGSGDAGVDVSINGGTTSYSTATETASLNVNPINDAPVLDSTGTMSLADVTANDANPTGSTVNAMILSAGGDRITDVDVGAVEGIAVVGVDETNGTWQYDAGIGWANFGTVSNSLAVLLDPNALIRFVPDPSYVGTAGAITFRAWDRTDGNSSGDFGIDVSVNGAATAYSIATETASLNVTPDNHAPVLIDTVVMLNAITEDSPAPTGAVGTLVSSVTDLSVPVGGKDNVIDGDINPSTGIAIISADTANGTWWHTIDGGSNWNPLGPASSSSARVLAADASTRIYFQPNADFNGTLPTAITFRAWDRTDGNPNGAGGVDTSINGGNTAYSAATDTAQLTVTSVNDAPLLDNTGLMMLTNVAEDDTDPAGDSASAIVASAGGDRITDVDAAAFEGLAVTGVDDTNGIWQYDAGGGWTNFGAVSDSSAVLLDPTDKIRFVPDPDYNGPSGTITFRGWDQTDGNSSGATGVDVSSNGGTSAYSSTTATANLAVTSINDIPMLGSFAGVVDTISEDTEAEIALAELMSQGDETDIDNPVNAFVVKSVAAGTLRIGTSSALANAWTPGVNDTIDVGNKAYWTTAPNVHGTQDVFDVVARDAAGAELIGGVTAQINVIAVNDAPVAAAESFTVSGNTTLVVSGLGVLSNDADVDADPLAAPSISGTANGTLTLNPDGSFSYTPNPGFVGTDTFIYVANDGTVNSDPVTVTITVNPLPPPPPVTPVDTDLDGTGTDSGTDADGTVSVVSPAVSPPPVSPPPPPPAPAPPSAGATPQNSAADPVTRAEPVVVEYAVEEPVDPSIFADQAPPPEAAPVRDVPQPKPGRQRNVGDLSFGTDTASLWHDLDQLGDRIDDEVQAPDIVIGSVAGATSVVSAGYVVWLLRGGHILAGMLAQLPAWRLIDPLPILAQLDDEDDEELEDDSLESLFDKPALDGRSRTASADNRENCVDRLPPLDDHQPRRPSLDAAVEERYEQNSVAALASC